MFNEFLLIAHSTFIFIMILLYYIFFATQLNMVKLSIIELYYNHIYLVQVYVNLALLLSNTTEQAYQGLRATERLQADEVLSRLDQKFSSIYDRTLLHLAKANIFYTHICIQLT